MENWLAVASGRKLREFICTVCCGSWMGVLVVTCRERLGGVYVFVKETSIMTRVGYIPWMIYW